MYHLFQYQQWFLQNIERRWIPEMTSAPCAIFIKIHVFLSKMLLGKSYLKNETICYIIEKLEGSDQEFDKILPKGH